MADGRRDGGVGRAGGVVSPVIADVIATAVALVWCGAVIAALVDPSRAPGWQVHAIAGGVIGTIFGFRIVTTKSAPPPDGEDR